MNGLEWDILEQYHYARKVSFNQLLVIHDVLLGDDSLVCELDCGAQIHEIT